MKLHEGKSVRYLYDDQMLQGRILRMVYIECALVYVIVTHPVHGSVNVSRADLYDPVFFWFGPGSELCEEET